MWSLAGRHTGSGPWPYADVHGVSDTGRIWARVEMGPQLSALDIPGDKRAVPRSASCYDLHSS